MLEKAQTKITINKCINDQSSQKHLTKTLSQNETMKFNKFDIVWAKITGYPWWPAIVTTLPGQKDSSLKEETSKNKYPWSKLPSNSKVEYRVDFIADQTHAFLKKNYLLNYLQNRDRLYAEGLQFSSRKRRYFQMAINEADQLHQVLEISKIQADQLNNKQKDCLKQSDNFSKEKEENISSQVQEEFDEKLTEIKNSKTYHKKIQPETTTVKEEKIQTYISIQNKISFEVKDFSFFKNDQKKQDNVTFVGPLTQKRKGKYSKIAQARLNKATRQQKKIHANNECQNKNQRLKKSAYQQTFAQKCERIFQQKDSFIQIIQQKFFENEIDVGQKMTNQKLQNSKITQFSQLNQRDSTFMQDLLQKYKLQNLDVIQTEFKKKSGERNRFEGLSSLQSKGSMGLKGNKSMMFIKNIYSNISKRRNVKKDIQGKYYPNQSNVFIQILSTLKNINQAEYQEIQVQRKRMIEYSIKCTARKIYHIISGIIQKNNILLRDQQVKANIKQRCINISQLIFEQQEDSEIKYSKKQSHFENNKKQCIYGFPSFFNSFKKKLQSTIRILKLLALENWELITKIAQFSQKLCFQIKNFEQLLQKQCHLTMRNEQKFQDLVKQIGIENQKTAFLYGSFGNQMQPQNESVIVQNNKYLESKKSKSILENLKNDILKSK